MAELFASGRIIDLILALVVLEVLAVAMFRRRTGRGIAFLDFVASLAPGVALLLALRAQAGGHAWTQVAVWLTVALLMHVVDVARRWQR